jgi:hypothetical protein
MPQRVLLCIASAEGTPFTDPRLVKLLGKTEDSKTAKETLQGKWDNPPSDLDEAVTAGIKALQQPEVIEPIKPQCHRRGHESRLCKVEGIDNNLTLWAASGDSKDDTKAWQIGAEKT